MFAALVATRRPASTTPTTRSRRACSASSSRRPPTRRCSPSSRRSTARPVTRPSSTRSIDAAEAGKQVLVLVEIKARFDEQANIRWARKLEQAGCHVVYGLVGLKTHCKLALVVRDEGGRHPPLRPHRHRQLQPQDRPPVRGPRPADRRRGHHRRHQQPVQQPVAGSPGNATTSTCFVAPESVRTGLLERIEREIDHQRAGRPARIRFKLNSLVDEAIIDALYRASQAGVPVELWVRGICALRPGVPGPVGEHQGAQHPRPLPRAQPDLLVRERRRAAGLDRLGRPDAPQPRPPGRGPRADPDRVDTSTELGDAARPRLRRRHVVVVAGRRRRLDPAPPRRRRPAPGGRPGRADRPPPPPPRRRLDAQARNAAT